jgi:hypothetical protein
MWKKAFVGAAALIVAGLMTIHAQEGPGRQGGWRPSAEDMEAFADARIAALHAGLKLNETQEKIWPAFEQAWRELAKMRVNKFSAPHEQQQPSDPVQRLQHRADVLSARGTALKRLADTMAPLYQSLDDGQKNRFTILARFMRPHRPDFHSGHGQKDGRGGDNFHWGPHHFGGGEDKRN